MTLAQQLMQKIEEEAVRTGSRTIKFGTFNGFLTDMGTQTQSGKAGSKRFQKQMDRLLRDKVRFDYEGSQTPRIRFEKNARVGGLLQRLMRFISSRITARLRRS